MIFEIFGTIKDPFATLNSTLAGSTGGSGLITLSNSILKLVIVGAGLFAFWNFIAAGYGFLSAGEDSKKITQAFAKFWQSLLGLIFIAGAFVLAVIFGQIIFGNPGAIISPTIYGPGATP
ncbi:MAG: hypothetical protein Q7S31_02810 [bacterium]|nr:hypothetical protein [bacterium]